MRGPPLSLSITTAPPALHTTTTTSLCSPSIRTPLHSSAAAPPPGNDNHSPTVDFYPNGPVTILPNLLLGSEQNASDVTILARHGVKCVLNVAKEVVNPLLEAKADMVPLTSRPAGPFGFDFPPASAHPATACGSWSALPFSPRPGAASSQGPKLPLPPRAQDFESTPSPSPSDMSFPSPASSASDITSSPSSAPPLPTTTSINSLPLPSNPYPLPAYLKIPWSHGEPDLSTDFQRAFSYIDGAVSQNLPVLVACQQGVSRSATLVIAYVMATRRMGCVEAYEFVKGRSAGVCPNVGFMAQLVEFEMALKRGREGMDVEMG
ncbi:hypothetical protein HDU67_004588 [Dinochytrium kinnereticum]|nr:hypothetical protein HDU67_004588 [Dinochytrium kinnereticum]